MIQTGIDMDYILRSSNALRTGSHGRLKDDKHDDLPIINGDLPVRYVKLPESNLLNSPQLKTGLTLFALLDELG